MMDHIAGVPAHLKVGLSQLLDQQIPAREKVTAICVTVVNGGHGVAALTRSGVHLWDEPTRTTATLKWDDIISVDLFESTLITRWNDEIRLDLSIKVLAKEAGAAGAPLAHLRSGPPKSKPERSDDDHDAAAREGSPLLQRPLNAGRSSSSNGAVRRKSAPFWTRAVAVFGFSALMLVIAWAGLTFMDEGPSVRGVSTVSSADLESDDAATSGAVAVDVGPLETDASSQQSASGGVGTPTGGGRLTPLTAPGPG